MTTTTTTNPLWELQAQYLPETFRQAEDIYFKGDVGPYSGPRVAGYDPVRAQGANLAVQAAYGPQTQLADAHSQGLLGFATGDAPTVNRLATQAATAAGAPFGSTFGGARHARAANEAAANAIAQNQLSALGQLPEAQRSALAPADTLGQVGRGFQDYQSQLINADKQLYDEQRNLPFDWLSKYQNALGFPGTVQPSSTVTDNRPTGFAGGVQSGLSNLGSSLIGGIGSALIGGLFAEGGEVPKQSKPMTRYQRAKMRKMKGRI